MSLGASLNQDTSAIPGGNKTIAWDALGRRHWRQIVKTPLPDDATLEGYVDKFFTSVDWFMMVSSTLQKKKKITTRRLIPMQVFDESLFREKCARLLSSSHVPYDEQNILWLFMVVVALGAHYTAVSPTETTPEIDLQNLTTDIMAEIEAKFLQLIGCARLEAVQISILLGSYLLFGGRPNVGLGISAAGVKIAQLINLHREKLWRDCSPAEIETRRRTWWALEVFDKYIAIAFGRPCVIDDSDCSVGMVSSLNVGSPNDTSTDTRLLFHQWKFRLYRIMGQFLGRRRHHDRSITVQTIHAELMQWKRQLPRQLCVESYDDAIVGEAPSIYQMQALALHLTFDNLQIILHRSVAFGQGSKIQTTPEGQFSLRHLVDAAMSTSSLHRFPNSLQGLRRTHANMHVGITLFTAGIVLCIVSLSQPLSSSSQRAKGGVMNIIRACEDSSNLQDLASRQSIAVLERLVAVVLQHENQLIIGKPNSSASFPGLPPQDAMRPTGAAPDTGIIGSHLSGMSMPYCYKNSWN